jgi:hypothetical protein
VNGLRHVLVPSWLLESAVSDRAIRLYALLRHHRNAATGQCNPSRKRLAGLLRCSKDSVDRALRELEEIRAVKVKRDSGLGNYEPNTYTLCDAPGVAAPLRPRSRTGADTGSRTGAARTSSKELVAGGALEERPPLVEDICGRCQERRVLVDDIYCASCREALNAEAAA